MENLEDQIAHIIQITCYERDHELQAADAAAAAIMDLISSASPPCEICGKPAEVVHCGPCDHAVNMED